MNKKLTFKICIICAAVLAVALLVFAVVRAHRQTDNRIFDLDKSDVVSLTFISGINGESKELSVDDRDGIDDILSKLCSLTYSSVKKSGISDGNSDKYKLTVCTAQGEETWYLSEQTAKVYRISYGTEITVYTYTLTPESKEIMKEIIALMPD